MLQPTKLVILYTEQIDNYNLSKKSVLLLT